jgi:hypothetical protein
MAQIRSLANDLAFGLSKETIENILTNNFGEEFKNTKELYNDEYYPYDFEGLSTKMSVEMKSRRNTKNQYPTTIIPTHKVRNTNNKQVFVFNFTNEMCYIEYSKELFDTFEKKMITTYRQGIIDVPKPHFLIPICHLKTLKPI